MLGKRFEFIEKLHDKAQNEAEEATLLSYRSDKLFIEQYE